MTRQGPVLPSGKWKLTAEGYRRLLDGWDRELRTKLAGDPAALGDLLASQVWLTVEYIQKHLPWLHLYRAVHPEKDHPAFAGPAVACGG